jgi:hypothetical protein
MSENVARRARLIGLVSGVASISGIGVLLLSDLGFNSLTHLQQLSLLLAAAVLWVVHMPLNFSDRYCSRKRGAARKEIQPLKGRKS